MTVTVGDGESDASAVSTAGAASTAGGHSDHIGGETTHKGQKLLALALVSCATFGLRYIALHPGKLGVAGAELVAEGKSHGRRMGIAATHRSANSSIANNLGR